MRANTTRNKRGGAGTAAAAVPTESEFHQIRTQEQHRTHAIAKLGASDQQVAPSYFTASLEELAAQRLADAFADSVEVDALREEQPQLYAMVLDRLPTDPETMLPLRVTVPRIMEERYWQRCCEARWSLGQLSRMLDGEKLAEKEYGWKRLFLERILSDFLMSLGSADTGTDSGLLPPGAAPRSTPTWRADGATAATAAAAAAGAVTCTARDADASRFDLSLDDTAVAAVHELCTVCRDYVHTIDLPCQLVHFNLYEHLFAHMPGILSFRLTYGVAHRGVRVGVTEMVGFRDADAAEMRQLLRHYTALEQLRLPLNRLQDRHVQMIAAGLASSTTLRVLDLSQNSLADAAVVDAVALLLCRPDFPLEELYLDDNNLGDRAAAALAEALQVNKSLRVLHVQQNCIGDASGGALLVRALAVQPTLTDVNLGHNRLGMSTLKALTGTLPQLTQLRVLCLAGNALLAGAKLEPPPRAPSFAFAAAAPSVSASGQSLSASAAAAGATTEPGDTSHSSLPSASSISATPASAKESAADTDIEEEEEEHGGEEEAERETADSTATNEHVPTARPSTIVLESKGAQPVESHSKRPPHVVPVITERTEGGVALAEAAKTNKSLVELDVRRCGFTAAEEQEMMCGVQRRVFKHNMDTVVAAREAEQRRELQRRAEERVSRMIGHGA